MWLGRALTMTLVAGALLVQGLLLVRFAADTLTAFLLDPDTHRGRWWHHDEPVFAFAGYLVLVVAAFLLARAWTRVVRPPREVAREALGGTDGGGGDDGEDEAVAIEMPSFLRPKTRRRRPGAAALAAWTLLGVLLVAAGATLGVVEAVQMWVVATSNAGDASALARNSTVWILRLMQYVAPALLVAGAAVAGAAWSVYWPLPPAREVVAGPKQKAAAKAEWQTVE